MVALSVATRPRPLPIHAEWGLKLIFEMALIFKLLCREILFVAMFAPDAVALVSVEARMHNGTAHLI